MQSTFVIFASILAMASATAINFEEPEFKTLLDTTSGNFLALNSTLLIGVVAVVVVLAVAALVASGSFSPAKIVQRYGQEYNQFYDTVDAYSQNRYRRSAANGKADFILFNQYLLILRLLYEFLLILLAFDITYFLDFAVQIGKNKVKQNFSYI